MIRNVRNIKLIAVLGILILGYAGLRFFKNTNRSSSFRAELVTIDTSKVDKLVILKGGDSFEVLKEQSGWKVMIGNNKTAEASSVSVRNAMISLLGIKPNRIATRDPEKWSDYQTDSSGTRVQVFEGNNNVLDLIIGRFGMRGNQQFHTFVRLSEDNEVYAADNFMGMTFPSDPAGYRNTNFLQTNIDSISQVVFRYPGDSSFILKRADEKWQVGVKFADSTNVLDYLSNLRFVTNSNFVDDIEPAALINPTFSIEINGNSSESVLAEAFSHPKYGYILHSSENPKSYFSDNSLAEKIFIKQSDLFDVSIE